ncbi:MAG: hypothetical protein QM708_15195 [Propioniciclava sp.]|uniref:hypothetical protein n=1 Tax=Propioniciclava sp. TaxID=2038686 RepID=UPI0039E293AE
MRRALSGLVMLSLLVWVSGCGRDPGAHARDPEVEALRADAVRASQQVLAPFLGLGTVVGSRVGDWCDAGQDGPIWKDKAALRCSYETHTLVLPAHASLDEATEAAVAAFERNGCQVSRRPAEARDYGLEHQGSSGIVSGRCGHVTVSLTAFVDARQVAGLNEFTPFPSTGFWVERTAFTDDALATVGTPPFVWAIKTSIEYLNVPR